MVTMALKWGIIWKQEEEEEEEEEGGYTATPNPPLLHTRLTKSGNSFHVVSCIHRDT